MSIYKSEFTGNEIDDAVGKVLRGELDSPLPIEVATEAEMTALLESGEVGGIYKYVGEDTSTYKNGAIYILKEV